MTTWNRTRGNHIFQIILLSLCVACVIGCTHMPNRETICHISIFDKDDVVFQNQKISISNFSRCTETMHLVPSATEFVFTCNRGTRHRNLLNVQRILSGQGFYRFSLDEGKRRVPIRFGPSCDMPYWEQPESILVMRIGDSLITIDNQIFPPEGIGIVVRKAINEFAGKNEPPFAVEIICEMESQNSVLREIVSAIPNPFDIKIFIVSI